MVRQQYGTCFSLDLTSPVGRLVARTSPTPVVDAAGAAPTPVNAASCTPRSGIIEITSTDGSITGYLADITTRFGQYGFSPNKTDAIQVHAHCDGNRFDVTTLVRTSRELQDEKSHYPSLEHDRTVRIHRRCHRPFERFNRPSSWLVQLRLLCRCYSECATLISVSMADHSLL